MPFGHCYVPLVTSFRKQINRHRQEIDMSGVNGDKARFNRRRRHKISRRISTGKMLKDLAEQKLVPSAKPENLKEKTA
jgi:hypothetical protein